MKSRRAASASRARGLAIDAAILAGVILLYALVLARGFLSRQYYLAGDAYLSLGMHSELFASLRQFHSLPWWDPTLCNGSPLYLFASQIDPFLNVTTLPSLLAFRVIDSLVHVPITAYVVFEATIYVFSLTLLAVYLISRELTEHRLAAAFPALTFGFCYIQTLNFKDGMLYPAVGPLFFVYGLVRYCRRRRRLDLGWLVLFLSVMISSMSNQGMQSAVFWTGALVLVELALQPGLLSDTYRLILRSLSDRRGRAAAAFGALLLAWAGAASYVPFRLNVGHFLRYRGGVLNYGAVGDIATGNVSVENSQIWTVLFNWLPFREVHDALLMFIGGAHEYRYIGTATIPLLLAAAILGAFDVQVHALLLAYFLCNAFLIYTTENLAYRLLLDHFPLLREIRNTVTLMPRGGASLFLVILSGVGLDKILRLAAGGRGDAERVRFLDQGLKALFLAGCGLLAGIVLLTGNLHPLVHTAAHVGVYLSASSLLCWMLLRADTAAWRRRLCGLLLVFAFMDLVVSISSRIDLYNEGAPFPAWVNMQARIPAGLLDARTRFPDDPALKPSDSESRDIFPPGYGSGGAVHHSVYAGFTEWLVLRSHGLDRRFLKNWDPATSIETDYPRFEFFTNGTYIPLERLKKIDHDRELLTEEPAFFLHDAGLVARRGAPARRQPGAFDLTRFSFNEVGLRTRTPKDGFLYYPDNYDRFWSAYVDGRRVPVYRANFTFKAVELPAGSHDVLWVYDPWPVRLAWYAYFALAAAALAWLLAGEAGLLAVG